MNANNVPPAADGPAQVTPLPSITEAQKALVQETFAQVAPIADHAAELFYDRLFQIDPDLRIMFKTDMAEQRRKLMDALELAVTGLDTPDLLVPVIQELGRRHKGYGVSDTDYDSVGAALLWTLEQGLGARYTDEVRDAWTAVYGLLSGVMKKGAAHA
ncbi:MAG: globin family protein [Methyloligellaceae bacterium]